MKTDLIRQIEKELDLRIDLKYKTVGTNNFVQAKEIMASAINKKCFEFMMSRFRSYYLKQYSQDTKDMVYNLVVEEENKAKSGFTLYEFAYQWGQYSVFFAFDFNIYGLIFSSTNKYIKNISIKKNTIKFQHKFTESSSYRTLHLITKDEAIKSLMATIDKMPTGGSMAFENYEFYKKRNGITKCSGIFRQQEVK